MTQTKVPLKIPVRFIMLAVRRVLTDAGSNSPKIVPYEVGLAMLAGPVACSSGTLGHAYFTDQFKGWNFSRGVTTANKVGESANCFDAKEDTNQLGLGVVIDGQLVRVPLPEALQEGDFEVASALRMARAYQSLASSMRFTAEEFDWIGAASDDEKGLIAARLLGAVDEDNTMQFLRRAIHKRLPAVSKVGARRKATTRR